MSFGSLQSLLVAVSALAVAPQGDIVELIIGSGAAVTTCPPWLGADTRMSQRQPPRKLVGASGQALPYHGVRELDFSVAARYVRVKFVVTDVMCPVLSVATLTEQGLKVEFRAAGMSCGSEQQWRRSLCGVAAGVWHLLDPDSRVFRKAVDRVVTLSETIEFSARSPDDRRDGHNRERQLTFFNAQRRSSCPTELSGMEIELHPATHISFKAWCSACVASRAKADPHWRNPTDDSQEKEHDVVSFDGSLASFLCMVDHVSGAEAVSKYMIEAMVASVANSSGTDIFLESGVALPAKAFRDGSETLYQRQRSCRTVLLEDMAAMEWLSA